MTRKLRLGKNAFKKSKNCVSCGKPLTESQFRYCSKPCYDKAFPPKDLEAKEREELKRVMERLDKRFYGETKE